MPDAHICASPAWLSNHPSKRELRSSEGVKIALILALLLAAFSLAGTHDYEAATAMTDLSAHEDSKR